MYKSCCNPSVLSLTYWQLKEDNILSKHYTKRFRFDWHNLSVPCQRLFEIPAMLVLPKLYTVFEKKLRINIPIYLQGKPRVFCRLIQNWSVVPKQILINLRQVPTASSLWNCSLLGYFMTRVVVYTKTGRYVHSYGTLFNNWFGTAKKAPSLESQLPEAWPASIYGHLREGYLSVPCEWFIGPS